MKRKREIWRGREKFGEDPLVKWQGKCGVAKNWGKSIS
jgi:hypothetical protein